MMNPTMTRNKRIAIFLFCAVVAVSGFACVWPINSGVTRLLTIGGAACAWGCVVGFVWKRKRLRNAVLVFSGVAILCVAVYPAREVDTAKLRARYVRHLRGYEGVAYVWGGEGRFGIDCSGLPRAALQRAQRDVGLRTLNFGLVRSAMSGWWFDASARALAEGYRNYAANVAETLLAPGDLAITTDGVHVMVYLGPDEWIHADPESGRVVIEAPSRSSNPWLARPVRFYRWRALAE